MTGCMKFLSIQQWMMVLLSSEVKRLKESEGGMQVMCEVMKKYEKLAVREERIDKIKKMIRKGYIKEAILDLDYTEEEYAEAEAELAQFKK